MSYQYRSLKATDGIRLVKLKPLTGAPSFTPLECQIVHVRLNKKPRYDAISYTWGQPEFTDSLLCGTDSIKITPNLASALRRFRFPNRARWLWVDAVCINQGDDEEKSRQVAMMGSIYSKAAEVLVWVGEEVESTGSNMEFLRRIADAAVRLGPYSDIKYLSTPFLPFPMSPMRTIVEDIRKALSVIRSEEELWGGIELALLQRPWFMRRWVVQEATLAKAATVFSGPHKISWRRLALGAAVIFKTCPDWADYIGYFYENLEIWATIYLNGLARNPFQILILLLSCDKFNCYDDKDRIYALFGLFKKHAIQIEPDYGASVARVYSNFAREWIIYCQGGDYEALGYHRDDDQAVFLLDYAGSLLTPSRKPLSDLPSWVPDWRPTNRHSMIGHRSHAGTKLHSSLRFSDDWRLLIVSGLYVDVVRETSGNDCPSLRRGDYRGDAQRHCHLTWLSILMKLDIDTIYITGESIRQAFARTLVADAITETVASDLYTMYSEWSQFYLSGSEDASERFGHSYRYNGQDCYGYAVLIERYMAGRRFFTTENLRIGIGPDQLEPGDIICIFYGAQAPCILRPKGPWFQYIGPCYLHGVMQGEAWETEGIQHAEFTLI